MVSTGYIWPGMEDVDYDEACECFEEGMPVYLLYDDNTEALAGSAAEIKAHNMRGGGFGIELTPYTCAESIYYALTTDASDEYAREVIGYLFLWSKSKTGAPLRERRNS